MAREEGSTFFFGPVLGLALFFVFLGVRHQSAVVSDNETPVVPVNAQPALKDSSPRARPRVEEEVIPALEIDASKPPVLIPDQEDFIDAG